MAPTRGRVGEKRDQLKEILDFASTLPRILAQRARPTTFATDLYDYIDRLSELNPNSSVDFQDVDEQGMHLYNLSLNLKQDKATSNQLACLVRVFACLLLDLAHQSAPGTASNALRVYKAILRSAKLCLSHGHCALGERLVEKAADYNNAVPQRHTERRKENQLDDSDEASEYLILRVALAWKQNRLDLAGSWLAKFEEDMQYSCLSSVEKVAELLYDIGCEQVKKKSLDDAVIWLEKAFEILVSRQDEGLSAEGEELKTLIQHRTARTLMDSAGDDAQEKAWHVAVKLDADQRDRLAVLTLKLDLYDARVEHSDHDYGDVLLRMIRSVHLSNVTVNTVLFYVHRLKPRNVLLAHSVLERFLFERLFEAEHLEWTNKVIAIMVWNVTSIPEAPESIETLRSLFDQLNQNLRSQLSADLTNCIECLICKNADAAYSRHEYQVAASWCRLALHDVLDQTAELNRGIIERKLILCYLSIPNYAKAREVYHGMSDTNQARLETQYLMYKIGLRVGDLDLSSLCLSKIYRESDKDATILYACVMEAQQVGKRSEVVRAMQQVLDKYAYGSPPGVHLPALLRCTARLLLQEIEQPGTDEDIQGATAAVCKLFKGAASRAKALQASGESIFKPNEIDWFSRNSYNTLLKGCSAWNPTDSLRLAQACIIFIDLYPNTLDSKALSDHRLRRMSCHFIAASLLVALARQEDVVDTELQYYLQVRRHGEHFREHLQQQMSSLEGTAKNDLKRKAMALLAYEYEAILRLKAWIDIAMILQVSSFKVELPASCLQLLQESRQHNDQKLWSVLADLTLSADVPLDDLIIALREIINMVHVADRSDIVKLAKWIRCLFQICLVPKEEIAEHLLGTVLSLAQDKEREKPYPDDELHWLATTTFNRAVDFYCASRDADCQRWAGLALAIAHATRDDGSALHAQLESKFVGLSFEA
ncbi:hypothetical protein MMC25_006003 [Agyrium rufum]|nr:hypothetical protein [Agyrium rufum]